MRIVGRLIQEFRPSPSAAGLLWMLRLASAVNPPLMAALAASVLASAVLPVAFTVVAGLLVGSVPATVQHGLASPAGHTTLGLLAVATALFGVTRTIEPLNESLATILSLRFDRHLQQRVMHAVGTPTGIAHLEDPQVLDRLRVAQGIGTSFFGPGDALSAFASVVPTRVRGLGSVLLLAPFHWWLALALLIAQLAAWRLVRREYFRSIALVSDRASAIRRSEYFRDLALSAGSAKELRLWGLLEWLTDRCDGEWRRVMSEAWRERARGRWTMISIVLTLTAAYGLALTLVTLAALDGDIGLGALAVYAGAIRGSAALSSMSHADFRLTQGTEAVRAVVSLQPLGTTTAGAGQGLLLPRSSPRQGIQFEGVTFRYPGQETDVLTNLELFIPAGESVAIVGPNGAGKTTLVKLLCRLYEPTAGRILIDGMDLHTVDVQAWRHQIAALFQDYVRYHLSARDNVSLSLGSAGEAGRQVRAAARKAGCLALVESLPQGWETHLSREYAGGVELSGGEWQRIALARALFATERGARVLILDEPTAHLDVRAEADLNRQMLQVTQGLTTILVSHRFSTVRRAAHIFLVAGGRVAEQGTHDELVAAGGQYADMYALQAARFAEEVAHGPAGSNW